MPLTVALFVHGVVGGAAGGVLVGIGLAVWSAIESGPGNLEFLPIGIGAWAGFVVGASIAVLAILARIAVLVFTQEIRWQVVAVVVASVVAPIIVVSLVGASGLAWFGLIVGGLAAVHLGRLVAKRLRRERSEAAGTKPDGESGS